MYCSAVVRKRLASGAAVCLTLCFGMSVALAQTDSPPSLEGFESYAQQALKDWKSLNHYHYDVFEIAEQDLAQVSVAPLSGEKVSFHVNVQGDINSLSVPFEPSVKDIVFTRCGDRSMQEKAFLQPLTGEYKRGAATMLVAMKGDRQITLTLPGQPASDLEPVHGTRFNTKGQKGSIVEFRGDDLVIYQGRGVSVATKQK